MKNVRITLLGIAIVLITHCTPYRISVSEGLSSAPELPVKGRQGLLINQKLSFGEYRTAKVNRSWTEGTSVNGGDMQTLWVKKSQSSQKIHFSMSDSSGNTSDVFCIAKVSAEDWTVGRNPNSIINIMGEILGLDGPSDNNYAVDIYLPKEPSPWQMRIDMEDALRNSKKYTGFLAQSKDKYYTIHPITTIEQNGKKGMMPIGSVGFEFRNKAGVALAAVSLIDNGKVYMSATDPKEKFLLANACSAMLLQENLAN